MVQRIDKAENDQDESYRLLYFYAIQYGLYVILFFLNCFADAEPKVKIVHTNCSPNSPVNFKKIIQIRTNFLTNQIVLMKKQQQRNKIRFLLIGWRIIKNKYGKMEIWSIFIIIMGPLDDYGG